MYVGFGSLVVDDPQGLTLMILSAAKRTHQRILLSRCRRRVSMTPALGTYEEPGKTSSCVAPARGQGADIRSPTVRPLMTGLNPCRRRGWGNLGEGFNIPPEVMLLDAVRCKGFAIPSMNIVGPSHTPAGSSYSLVTWCACT